MTSWPSTGSQSPMSARSPRTSPCRTRALRPTLDGLEARILLYATSGDHFGYGSRITWSIVPDGTSIAGSSSNLVATFNARFGAGNWLRPIQEAFAVWESAANVNFAQV